MQINVSPVPAFQLPSTLGTVGGVGNVAPLKPVREEGDPEESGGNGGFSPGNDQRDSESPQIDRRGTERRSGEDRRKQLTSVLLDTRVGERRKTQRRPDDPPPPAVDFKV